MSETILPGKIPGTQLRYIKPEPCESVANSHAEPESVEDREIARLAKLSLVDYDRERLKAAERLGVRVPILDKLVAANRAVDESAPGSGRPLELASPEPWPTPVNGAELVDGLAKAIRKYVALSADAVFSVALWVLHAHCFELFPCTPRLAITAPEKRCGKTTLLDVIKPLVPRALLTTNVTAAATFRTVESLRPGLLIDEADTFLGENEELRGILNSGHRQGGQVIRTVGDDHEPRMFATHCPVAIAQIGKLPDTLADRSIHVQLKRRAPDEMVARLRTDRTPELLELARKAAKWVADNREAIRECDPFIPEAIYNRAADNWEPLLAIAEIIGGSVPEQARAVALAACSVEEELSRGEMLLADIHEVFADSGAHRMTSADLTAALVAMADKPWCELNHGKPLTQNGLARRLKGFGICHRKLRVGNKTPNGYELATFEDAFLHYLPNPAFQSGTTRTSFRNNELCKNTAGTRSLDVPVASSYNSLISLNVRDVPVQNPETGETRALNDVPDVWESDL